MEERIKVLAEFLGIEESEILMEMTNLSPKRTGLKVAIWSDGNGKSRNKKGFVG